MPNALIQSLTNAILLLSVATNAITTPKDVYTKLNFSCASLPNYDPETDIAGPINLIVEGTNSGIEGVAANIESFTSDGTNTYGFVCGVPFILGEAMEN
jgi:hypothetical protein